MPELQKYFPDPPVSRDQAPRTISKDDGRQGKNSSKESNKVKARDDLDDSDEEREQESLRLGDQLKQAKKEQTELLKSLATARQKKSTLHIPNGDDDQYEIENLRDSLAQKKRVLNDLRERRLHLDQT